MVKIPPVRLMTANTIVLAYIKPIPMCHEAINQEDIMRTVSIFKNGDNCAIRLPRDLDFEV